jgi:DnaJ-class molecular chaperone
MSGQGAGEAVERLAEELADRLISDPANEIICLGKDSIREAIAAIIAAERERGQRGELERLREVIEEGVREGLSDLKAQFNRRRELAQQEADNRALRAETRPGEQGRARAFEIAVGAVDTVLVALDHALPSKGTEGCERCKGSGETISPAPPGDLAEFVTCPDCDGTGKKPAPPKADPQ